MTIELRILICCLVCILASVQWRLLWPLPRLTHSRPPTLTEMGGQHRGFMRHASYTQQPRTFHRARIRGWP